MASDILTRRQALKRTLAWSAGAAGAGMVGQAGFAGAGPGPLADNSGIFFGAGDLERLRRNYRSNIRFAELRQRLRGLDRAKVRHFLAHEVQLDDPLGDLNLVQFYGRDLALVALLDDDEKAAELARECARTMVRFPVWDIFQEAETGRLMGNQRGPSGVIALACIIAWLGDRVDGAEREAWLDALAQKGCAPCGHSLEAYADTHHALPWEVNPATQTYADRSAFPVDGHRRIEICARANLRTVPAGALAIGAVLLQQQRSAHPSLAHWFDLAEQNIAAFAEFYHPDGSYGEGVNYGNYASESLFMGIEALRRAGRPDLTKRFNWPGNVEFMQGLAMPIERNRYEVINISDNGRRRGGTPNSLRVESRSALPFWVARRYRDGRAQWFGENLAAHHNLWSLVFYDERVAPIPPVQQSRLWVADVEWPVMRTGYRSADLVTCLRSGNGYPHEHADRNSVIVKAFGEELVVDPMRPPYHFADPSWMLRTTAGHSGVLINGQGHFYHNGSDGTERTFAQARLVDRADTRDYALVTSDATQAYRLVDVEIKQVVRSMIVFYDAAVVVIVDRLGMYHHPADFEARFMTENWDGELQLSAGDGRFTIERPFARAHGQVHGRTPITVSTGKLPIPEERAEKNPFVAVRTEGAQTTTLVTTMALSPQGGRPAKVDVTTTSESFVVNVAGRHRCEITDSGRYPGVNITAG